jgi:hypothetical protein
LEKSTTTLHCSEISSKKYHQFIIISTHNTSRILKIESGGVINELNDSFFIQDQATIGLFSMSIDLSSIIQVSDLGFRVLSNSKQIN